MNQNKEQLKDSVAALKAVAICIASAVDNEEPISGDQIYQLLNVIANHQEQLLK